MPRIDIVVRSEVVPSARLMQVASMFELEDRKHTEERWAFDVDIPTEWSIGAILGPSGSGKSTVARELFGERFIERTEWPTDRSVIDGFPASTSVRDISEMLSAVGFSSPPAWLRPYHVLSTGQRFRCDVARALLSAGTEPIAFDEFSSVVDRTVAQVGSAAVAKAIRRRGAKFVAVSCHNDIVDWLQPDWILEMPSGTLTRRSVQPRPRIELEISRVSTKAWDLFRPHHYLDTEIHKGAACFLATWGGLPVAFTAVLSYPHPTVSGWRGHRTVVLPDFQGVGIGSVLTRLVASCYAATKPYRSVTSHPAMIRASANDPLWTTIRAPSRTHSTPRSRATSTIGGSAHTSWHRYTASFEYCGPIAPIETRRALGLL